MCWSHNIQHIPNQTTATVKCFTAEMYLYILVEHYIKYTSTAGFGLTLLVTALCENNTSM